MIGLCQIIEVFFQLFELSFWRHPFTADEHCSIGEQMMQCWISPNVYAIKEPHKDEEMTLYRLNYSFVLTSIIYLFLSRCKNLMFSIKRAVRSVSSHHANSKRRSHKIWKRTAYLADSLNSVQAWDNISIANTYMILSSKPNIR